MVVLYQLINYRIKTLLFTSLLFLAACQHRDTMFTEIDSSKSGITFNNTITENDSINPIDMEFLYNGGGVAIGDFNNDGLPDVYFSASQVSNKFYLNKGDFTFRDVTEEAQVTGEGRWCNAASVVDINNDGWMDIYVCTTIKKDPAQRANLFYINQGNQKDGVPLFKEMAKECNLADTGFSVHAPFFDFDNDGDLDMYLVNTKLAERNSTRFDGGSNANTTLLSDKLYRNDGASEAGGLPVFTDISTQAGIKDEGFGLGVAIADVNNDGWKDIYVTNDFFSSDALYINQKDGTFSNKVFTSFKHTSRNAMGNDIADINNDGLQDILAVDMNPADNFRKKKNIAGNNYYQYQNMISGGIVMQYVRNTLQLNEGLIKDTDGIEVPVFSDIAYYAGVAETDWSWSPLFADFDNDGYKDLFITNGYPKDVTDQDFAFFKSNYSNLVTKTKLLAEIPQIKIPNYAYRNSTTLRFEDVSNEWGLNKASFSAGAAYIDLDNDGDLDYIVSNINDKAFVYENRSERFKKNNFLNIRFKGSEGNRFGIGAVAEIFYSKGKKQVAENSPYRGYLSTMDACVHFGLDSVSVVDSIRIKWPGGKQQTIIRPAVNQVITADITKAAINPETALGVPPIFHEISNDVNVHLRHLEADYIDFDIQRLLPHKLSEYGPGIAAGDVDGNGLDDLFVGASHGFEATFLLQQPTGRFIQKDLPAVAMRDARKPEIMGLLLFDADKDGDLDLYTASGSNESVEGSKDYQDRLFKNDGKGNFIYDSTALPKNLASKSCVKAVDFDNDGDLDLFVGSRLIPARYPIPASSFIFRNDSEKGSIKFTDVTKEVAPGLEELGLVCDAIWSDYDNDGWIDLVIAGEWMPITFFQNIKGKLKKITTGLQDKMGWWNSLAAGDFDNDGDIDYVAGNQGENSYYRGDSSYPVRIYTIEGVKDGRQIPVVSLYLTDTKGEKKEFPAHSRDDIISQLPALKKKFLTYESFGEAEMNNLFSKDDLKNGVQLIANYFKSVFIENKGKGEFSIQLLPEMAQMAPLNGMVVDDINHDGYLDIIVNGNDYGTEVSTGRFDALNGLVLLGNGKGFFTSVSFKESGFFVPGNARALVKLKGIGNEYLLAASQNRSCLKIFRKMNGTAKLISLNADDREVYYTMVNGDTRKEELYYGTSFLSQSSRFICIDATIKKIEIFNQAGEKRVIQQTR
ncbi:MAG: VCBS repeat-containing protein [Chitinophagaceae bacterium]